MNDTRIVTGWSAALEAADEHIRHWKDTNVSPLMAAAAIDLGEFNISGTDEAHWVVIRRRLAAWYMTHSEAGK